MFLVSRMLCYCRTWCYVKLNTKVGCLNQLVTLITPSAHSLQYHSHSSLASSLFCVPFYPSPPTHTAQWSCPPPSPPPLIAPRVHPPVCWVNTQTLHASAFEPTLRTTRPCVMWHSELRPRLTHYMICLLYLKCNHFVNKKQSPYFVFGRKVYLTAKLYVPTKKLNIWY